MHRALLIDELLRQIFSFVWEDDSETLGALARSCRAWTGPALDLVWMSLTSVVPLIRVIPDLQLVGGVYVLGEPNIRRDMTRFHSYARRVKHIAHRHSIQVHPDLLSFLMTCHSNSQRISILPSLQTAQISYSTCNAFQAALSLSTELHHLQLDLGFKARASTLSDDVLLDYLACIAHFSHLETLSIRGFATKRLNVAISSLKNVKVLSLCLGVSLTTHTLMAVTSYSRLSEFEVHATHFAVEELRELFHNRKSPMFPSLQKLHIRAHASVIELFLHALPDDSLRTLCMEVQDPTCTTVYWANMFDLICTKSTNTLQNLTIEHHTELDNLDLEINSANTHPDTDHDVSANDKLNICISFTTLRILGGLHCLRTFILDTTLPVGICDRELEFMLGWWPELEHLDLGTPPITHSSYANSPAWQPLSSHSLVAIAKKSAKLTSLVLPVDISWARNAPTIDIPEQLVLTRLTCVYPFPTTHTEIGVAEYLHRLFPSLWTVDGLSYDEDLWNRTQIALQRLAGQKYHELYHSIPRDLLYT
ncbi:hypothetical protein L208DRAFT_1237534 [Tricholoma matsutake]|nr:hypothetical protein L208DRAFT_1237534 [Tricholoma matsutake 945]